MTLSTLTKERKRNCKRVDVKDGIRMHKEDHKIRVVEAIASFLDFLALLAATRARHV